MYGNAVVTQIWNDFLSIAREEAGNPVVETWFKAVSCLLWDNQKKILYLKAPNQFIKNWIIKNYTILLHTHLARLLNEQGLVIEFVDAVPQPELVKKTLEDPSIVPARVIHAHEATVAPNIAVGHTRHSLSKGSSANRLVRYEKQQQRATLHEAYTFDTLLLGRVILLRTRLPLRQLKNQVCYIILFLCMGHQG